MAKSMKAATPVKDAAPVETAVEAAEVNPYPTDALPASSRTMTAETSAKTFKRALAEFRKSVHNTMYVARVCAELAILHFEQHGDLVYAQAFLDAMPKNFVRRAAYLKWLKSFSPVTMTAGKLAKDKGENAVAFDTAKALENPFWDFTPAPDHQVMWGEADIVKSLKSAIRRFENNNYTPKDEKATAKLAAAKRAIEKLA